MMEFTGKELNYLHVCRRKLWLFRHGIRPELENDLVQLGMLLGEETFTRQEKEIPDAVRVRSQGSFLQRTEDLPERLPLAEYRFLR